jgi:cytoskeletal protein RodZ
MIVIECCVQEISEQLRRAREAKKLDLADVSDALKIHKRILAAFESGDFSTLPEPALARGFLRRYASYLGLDADQILSLFPGKLPSSTNAGEPSSVFTQRPTVDEPNHYKEAVVSAPPTNKMLWAVPIVLTALALLGLAVFLARKPAPLLPPNQKSFHPRPSSLPRKTLPSPRPRKTNK